jgi:CheY-like chemotaxis protein/GGDEF domain-containing protein
MVELEASVLIVDDEKSDLERVSNALAAIRLRVSTVSDPHEVLRKVGAEKPDLVILDALLPGLSGFDLCKQIKTEQDTKSTLVLILTGVYLKDHYRREALHQFKADGFVTKPFRNRELQRLVLKLLAKKLQVSPKDLQESLAESQDILLASEVEERPSWFGRIFGRLKGAPAESGFLSAAKETIPADEPALDEGDASDIMEEVPAEGDERKDDVTEEPEEAEVTALAEDVLERTDGESGVSAESETDEPEADVAETAEKATEEPKQSVAETVTEDETESRESTDDEKKTGPQSDDVGADVGRVPPLDSGAVDLQSARAVAEVIGNGKDADEESDEEGETEKTLPAMTVPASTPPHEKEVPEEPRESEDAGAIGEETGSVVAEEPAPPPRPRALHENLPIYQEEDYLHELKRELLMCARVGSSLTLIMVRIADLDQIVELLGRQFRPKVLFHVAEQALESLREIDMVGLLESKELIALTAFASDRWGGDKIVSRVRTLLGHNPFHVGEGLPSFIPDLRFGMAVYPKEVDGVEALLASAEEELEKSRRSGR